MTTGRLDKSRVSRLRPPSAGKRFLWDQSWKGFGTSITPIGRISYTVQYRVNGGVAKRYRIGRRGSPWTPQQACEAALSLLSHVAKDIDPIQKWRMSRVRELENEQLIFRNFQREFIRLHMEA